MRVDIEYQLKSLFSINKRNNFIISFWVSYLEIVNESRHSPRETGEKHERLLYQIVFSGLYDMRGRQCHGRRSSHFLNIIYFNYKEKAIRSSSANEETGFRLSDWPCYPKKGGEGSLMSFEVAQWVRAETDANHPIIFSVSSMNASWHMVSIHSHAEYHFQDCTV
jgi:hypothetical protein